MSSTAHSPSKKKEKSLFLLGFAIPLIFIFFIWSYTPGPSPFTHLQPYPVKHSDTKKKNLVDTHIQMAGSGSNLPITRLLLKAFLQTPQGKNIHIKLHKSIGSTGGIQATIDRTIHLGLISRPLTQHEQKRKLRVVPYARAAVVLATHPKVPLQNIQRSEILELYQGKKKYWKNGQRVLVYQRERGDSSHQAFAYKLPKFSQINEQAYQKKLWQILYKDSAMQRQLQNTEGAVGLLDLGLIQAQKLKLNILRINGIYPTEKDIRSNRYPYTKELAFVLREPINDKCKRFMSFVFSPAGAALLKANHYIPYQKQRPQ